MWLNAETKSYKPFCNTELNRKTCKTDCIHCRRRICLLANTFTVTPTPTAHTLIICWHFRCCWPEQLFELLNKRVSSICVRASTKNVIERHRTPFNIVYSTLNVWFVCLQIKTPQKWKKKMTGGMCRDAGPSIAWRNTPHSVPGSLFCDNRRYASVIACVRADLKWTTREWYRQVCDWMKEKNDHTKWNIQFGGAETSERRRKVNFIAGAARRCRVSTLWVFTFTFTSAAIGVFPSLCIHLRTSYNKRGPERDHSSVDIRALHERK